MLQVKGSLLGPLSAILSILSCFLPQDDALDDPTFWVVFPVPHCVHTAAVPVEYDPIGHCKQSAVEPPGEYEPAEHALQVAPP